MNKSRNYSMFDMKAIRLNWCTVHIFLFHGKVGENNDTPSPHSQQQQQSYYNNNNKKN